GNGGAGGAGGAVSVTSTGSIATSGAGAHGVFAQSIGGGGGVAFGPATFGLPFAFAGSNGDAGMAGDVTVTTSADISATGANAFAILAQSEGGSGNGRIAIDVNGGHVTGGSGAGAAVGFLGGSDNRLVNHGTLGSVSGLAGYAITGGAGDETVTNYGTVIGNIDLGAGNNHFVNEAGATLHSGAILNLGSGALLENSGALSPGGVGVVHTTALTAGLHQEASAVYQVDLDFAGDAADRVNVSGAADLAGTVALSTQDPAAIRPGTRQVTILSAAGGTTDAGLGLAAQDTAVVHYWLAYPNANDVALTLSVDFAPFGLNRNETAIGRYFNSVQVAGSAPALGPMIAGLVALPGVRQLGAAYDQLSPEPYASSEVVAVLSRQRFADQTFGCPDRGRAEADAREADCAWLNLDANRFDSDASVENFAYAEHAETVTAGIQKVIAQAWRLGAALAYQDGTLDVRERAMTEGHSVMAGLSLSRSFGRTTVGASLTGSAGSYDTTRYIDFPTPGARAHGARNDRVTGAGLRVAHDFERGGWYVRPTLDGGFTHVRFDAVSESGAGAADLEVAERSASYGHVRPAIEIGGEASAKGGTAVRPHVVVGVTRYLGGTEPELTARLAAAPAQAGTFVVREAFDQTYFDATAGIDVVRPSGAALRLDLLGQFSSHTRDYGAMLKVLWPF
ncbi:MAG: autotransporter domain-containing protein, partial [Proteobacteria bacterium]|nr:autotransporter domain-containing protein [Pseudomonadota bacterium]